MPIVRRGSDEGDDASYHSVTMVTARAPGSETLSAHSCWGATPLSCLLAGVAPGRGWRVHLSLVFLCKLTGEAISIWSQWASRSALPPVQGIGTAASLRLYPQASF